MPLPAVFQNGWLKVMLEDTALTFDALLLESGGRSKDVNILGIPSTQVVQGTVEKSPDLMVRPRIRLLVAKLQKNFWD